MGLSFTSSDVPKGIPDDGTVNSLIYVPPPTPGTAPLIVGSLTVTLDIKHTFNLDLDVYLYHQDLFTGKAVLVKLFSHVGGPLDDFPNITFSDNATTSIRYAPTPLAANQTWQPEGNLSDFAHMNAQGEWQLRVTDTQFGNVGTLDAWSLTITPCNFPSAPTVVNPAHGVTCIAISPKLQWNDPSPTATPVRTFDVYLGVAPNKMILVASGLTDTQCMVGPLALGTQYFWQVVARNNCGQTPSPTWSFTTVGAPIILVENNVLVPADKNGQADVQFADIDLGSLDPCGGALVATMNPPGPYQNGTTTVIVTITNGFASANATVTVTVLNTPYWCKICAINTLVGLQDLNQPDANLNEAIRVLKLSVGVGWIVEADRIVWADAFHVAQCQGGLRGDEVFKHELKACNLLADYLKTTVGASKATNVGAAYALLARADRMLADTAISDAIFHGAPNATIASMKTLRNQANKDAYSQNWIGAVMKYAQAWQVAIASLGKVTDYNRDGTRDATDLQMFSADFLADK